MTSVYFPVSRIGLGLMLATALENNGAVVYIVGRRLSILEQAAAERNVRLTLTSSRLLRLIIDDSLYRDCRYLFRTYCFVGLLHWTPQRYRNMIPVQCDITSRSELLRLVNTVRDLSGHVDILINNAGQASGACLYISFLHK